MKEFLRPGRYVDSAHPAVIRFSKQNSQGSTARERAVSLYYAVRDQIRYNPFLDFSDTEVFKASSVLAADPGLVAAKPLFRDPVFDGAADPRLIWNPQTKRWWMFYTNRRGNVPGRPPGASKDTTEQRRSSIQVTELKSIDGWLTCDRNEPTHIALLPPE